MGEMNDVDDAEQKREANSQKAVDTAQGQPVEQLLDNFGSHCFAS
jgi:hypothetical protein